MKTGNSHKNHWDYILYLNFKNVPYSDLYRALFFWNGFFIKTFVIVAWRMDNHCTIAKLRHNILGLTITNFYKVCENILRWRLIGNSSLGFIVFIRHEINPKCFFFFFILLRHSKVTILVISISEQSPLLNILLSGFRNAVTFLIFVKLGLSICHAKKEEWRNANF